MTDAAWGVVAGLLLGMWLGARLGHWWARTKFRTELMAQFDDAISVARAQKVVALKTEAVAQLFVLMREALRVKWS